MSVMDIRGRNTRQGLAVRQFAVLWILFAALAMQFVLSAQAFSAWGSAVEKAGSFSVPEEEPSDQALSRHAMRSTPVADLRFSADRPDGKPLPGGTGPFLLPVAAIDLPTFHADRVSAHFLVSVRTGTASHHIRVRAPPAIPA